MRRVLRCDGMIPVKRTPEGISYEVSAEDIRAIKAYVDERRGDATPFDLLVEGDTPGNDREQATSIVEPLADAGVTWWLESALVHHRRGGLEAVRARIRQGPPRPE